MRFLPNHGQLGAPDSGLDRGHGGVAPVATTGRDRLDGRLMATDARSRCDRRHPRDRGLYLVGYCARRCLPNTVNAPTRLLTRGPFAYVRNPLYLSAGAVFVGMTTMYGLWQRRDAIILPIIGLMVHLFVVYREEPKTRERLGPVYDTYRSTVPRWVPRF